MPLDRLALTMVLLVGVAARSEGVPAPHTTLIDAVQRQDRPLIRRLLKDPRTQVNAARPDGATALHWAVHRDDGETVDLLLRAGATVDVVNEFGVTPLSLACVNGNAAVIERLLKAGAQVNRALPSGETPLMTASRVGTRDAVAVLLDHGADVNASEHVKGQTALMWAISEGHFETVRLLIARRANVQARSLAGFTPLMFTARLGQLDMVKAVLQAGAEINDENNDGHTALLIATVRGFADVAMYMLDRGANPNTDKAGFSPLHWASGKWESQTTHDYPDAGGEWEALGGIKRGKVELIRALVARGAKVNARLTKSPPRFGYNMFAQIKVLGGTPFWIAALSADTETMKLLVSLGANPVEASDEGVTPLMVAAGVGRVGGDSLISESDSVAATLLCLTLGNDVNAQATSTGYTALHGTAFYGLDEVAKVLVEHGADLEIKNKKGETALRIAEGTVNQAMFISHPSTAEVLRKLAADKARTGAAR